VLSSETLTRFDFILRSSSKWDGMAWPVATCHHMTASLGCRYYTNALAAGRAAPWIPLGQFIALPAPLAGFGERKVGKVGNGEKRRGKVKGGSVRLNILQKPRTAITAQPLNPVGDPNFPVSHPKFFTLCSLQQPMRMVRCLYNNCRC